MSSIDLEMLGCFCDEGLDLLVKWESVCIDIEKLSGSKEGLPEKLNDLFRSAHNLKGSSRAVGLEKFGNFVHKIEDGIAALKAGNQNVSGPVVAALLEAQEVLVKWLQEARNNPSYETSTDDLIARYNLALSAPKDTATQSATQDPGSLPGETEEIEATAPSSATAEAATLEQAESEIVSSTVTATVAKTTPNVEPIVPPVVQSKPLVAKPDETVRVSAKKLDQILEMVGELSIHQSVIWHIQQEQKEKNSLLERSAYLSRKLTKDLYEQTLSLRMYPVQPIFQRLERSIMDIARTLSKKVEVELIGGEVELDKTVCERIVEPLTHMVRNSVDHGLENAEGRALAGKSEVGRVKISAVQESGSVALLIQDDGKGLNEEKIIEKAIAQKMITDASQLSKPEIFAMIFLPGFVLAHQRF